jgi:hypothetical protein
MSYYAGHCEVTGRLHLLNSVSTPDETSYGGKYGYVIGPFKTKRAAVWAVKYGNNNPHFRHVNDAERIARNA